jgi:UDP-N-acetylglucosamine 4,6-dehydratase/5-epimerase
VRSVLITGGSGFFGRAFVDRLLTAPYEFNQPVVQITPDGERLLHPAAARRICVYSRDEHKQAAMREAWSLEGGGDEPRLRFFIGDVRDKDRLWRAMRGVDVVVHAAALKRIDVGWYDPDEVAKTNVIGAMNVIAAAELAGVERVVALSTDKAYQPVSPYGLSKAMAEALFLNANNARGSTGPRFAVCRYGNVWGSTGSVAPRWKALMKAGISSVPLTDPECTRFFMRIGEAVDLVLNTIETMPDEVAIPTLPAYRLGDLAEAMGAQTHTVGLPAWEKRHESMSDGVSSDLARRMTVNELKEALCSIG